jgi:uncharacterized protein (TIGR00369 family)
MAQAFDAKAMEARMRQVFEEIVPFNRVLGLKLESVDPQAPKIRFDMRPDLVGNPMRQILHGGVISATLDVTGGFVIQMALLKQGTGETGGVKFPNIGTINLNVDYLRPGRGAYFIATGRVVRLGNRIAVAHMELANDAGDLIATGSAAYVVG